MRESRRDQSVGFFTRKVAYRNAKHHCGAVVSGVNLRRLGLSGCCGVFFAIVGAHEQIVSLDAKISEFCDTISDDDRYTHQGYLEAEDARFAAIDRLSEIPAQSWKGIKAKAAALKMRQIQDDYQRTAALAESLADDVLQLSGMVAA
jgi:hypothetical protein